MKCRACGAPAQYPRGEKDGVSFWGCDCGSLNADLAATHLPNYSDAYTRATFEAPPAVRRSLADIVESVERYREFGSWADIGYGEGGLLIEAQRLGWNCAGTEISLPALGFGRTRGWDVRKESSEWPDESFDVVSLMEILEHVMDPEALLREAVRLLRPAGALIATTPNIGSLNFRILGLRWSIVAPPEHITLFSAKALGRLVGKTPLEIRSLRTTGLNPTELMRRRKENTTAAERNAGAQRLIEATASPSGRLAKGAANAVLNLFRVGDSLKLLATKPPRAGGAR